MKIRLISLFISTIFAQETLISSIDTEIKLLEKIKINLAKSSYLLQNLEKDIKLQSNNKYCSESTCYFLEKDITNPNKHLYNKNLKIKNIFFGEKEKKILNFHILTLGKYNFYEKNFPKNQNQNHLILFFDYNSFFISDPKGKILYENDFLMNITYADFNTFEEDSTIVLYNDKSEIHMIQLELKFNGNLVNSMLTTIPDQETNSTNPNENEFSVNVTYISNKSLTVDINKGEEIVSFQQNRVMTNKYIIIALKKGQVLVYTRDLEIRSSLTFPDSINNIFVHQGILGTFTPKNLVFLNMLGGNAIVVSCYNYFSMIDAVYDGLNGFLFSIDTESNLLVYIAKISLSKQNSNECYQIYKYKIKNMKKYARLKLFKQNLYIFTDTNYIAVIDLKIVSENGIFFVNEYRLSHRNLQELPFSYIDEINSIEANFIGFENFSYLYMKNDFLKKSNSLLLVKVKPNKKNEKLIETGTNSENFVSLHMPQSSKNEGYGFLIYYLIVVVVVSLVVFYFKKIKPNQQEETKGKRNVEENSGQFQEMLDKLKSLEKTTKDLKAKTLSQKGKKMKEQEVEEEEED